MSHLLKHCAETEVIELSQQHLHKGCKVCWTLCTFKRHSQELIFSKHGSESTFVSSYWATFNMVISPSKIKASNSSQPSQHFIYLRDVY